MCLDTIVSKKLTKEQKSGFGYKVTYQTMDSYVTTDTDFQIPKNGQWIIDKNKYSIYGIHNIYKTGFHTWKTLLGAKFGAKYWKKWHSAQAVIIKVEYKDAHTIGEQEGYKVIVAKRMRFVKEVK